MGKACPPAWLSPGYGILGAGRKTADRSRLTMKVLCAWHPQAAPRSRAWRPPRAQPQRRQCLPESEGDEGAAPLEPAEGPSRTRVCDDRTETALLPGSDQSTCLLILLTWSKTQAKGHCRGQTLAGTGATCRPGTPTLNARPPGSRRPERRRFSATVPAAAPPRERRGHRRRSGRCTRPSLTPAAMDAPR